MTGYVISYHITSETREIVDQNLPCTGDLHSHHFGVNKTSIICLAVSDEYRTVIVQWAQGLLYIINGAKSACVDWHYTWIKLLSFFENLRHVSLIR